MAPLDEVTMMETSITKESPSIEQLSEASSSTRFSSRKSEHLSQTATTFSSKNQSTKKVQSTGDSVFVDVIVGFILFFGAFPCLWFNERGYAYTKTFLAKHLKLCETVRPEEVDPNNEGKLLCISGETLTQDLLVDPTFEVKVDQSIRLTRQCEMYQWVETRHTRRINDRHEEVYYTYDAQWMSHFVDSSGFSEAFGRQNNRQDWHFDQWESQAPLVTYGMYKLTETQKGQCKRQEHVEIPQSAAELIASRLGFMNLAGKEVVKADFQPQKYVSLQNEYMVISRAGTSSSQAFSVGDFRVKFTRTPCGPITVVGRQSVDCLDTFIPEEQLKEKEQQNSQQNGQNYDDDDDLQSGNCCCACCVCCGLMCQGCKEINAPISEINWVTESHQTKKQMFQKALSDYETKTWLFRLLGFFMFMFGVYFMLSPVYTLLYWFPLVGQFLGAVGSFICGLVGFLIAIPLTILTISIAWVFYRKEIGIPLLLIALGLIGYFSYAYIKDGQDQTKNQAMIELLYNR